MYRIYSIKQGISTVTSSCIFNIYIIYQAKIIRGMPYSGAFKPSENALLAPNASRMQAKVQQWNRLRVPRNSNTAKHIYNNHHYWRGGYTPIYIHNNTLYRIYIYIGSISVGKIRSDPHLNKHNPKRIYIYIYIE